MGNFDFGSLASKEVKKGNYLRAYNIYENVKFTGVDDVKTGTSANGNDWKSWAFHFECPDGEFTKSIFEPKDNERPKYKNAQGHEYERPSNHESNLAFLFLVGQYFNPDGLEKMKKNMNKVDNYDTLIKLFKLCITPSDNTTSMKLVGRNSNGTIYAEMPAYCGLNKEGDWFPVSNSVFGDKVAFTAYELGKKKEYESAKPTNMASVNTDTAATEDDSDSDVDDLLADI